MRRTRYRTSAVIAAVVGLWSLYAFAVVAYRIAHDDNYRGGTTVAGCIALFGVVALSAWLARVFWRRANAAEG
jgi:hypothetical protein